MSRRPSPCATWGVFGYSCDAKWGTLRLGANDDLLGDVEEFLTGARTHAQPEVDRVLGTFADRGEQALRGVPGVWRVFAVAG